MVDEGADPLSPKSISFEFREVGVPDQKSVAIPGDGPREQFIIGLIGGHGGDGITPGPQRAVYQYIRRRGSMFSAPELAIDRFKLCATYVSWVLSEDGEWGSAAR